MAETIEQIGRFPEKSKPVSDALLGKLSKIKVLRKWTGRPFLAANEVLWNLLPSSIATGPLRSYGSFLHSLVKLRTQKAQYYGTFFLRNRAELSMLRRLANDLPKGATLKMAILACSNGAEVYSVLWALRSARRDLKIITHATDISSEILEIAQKGRYSLTAPRLVDSPIFERLTGEEMREIFDVEGDHASVKAWIRDGISWQVADAGDPELINISGQHDIVLANKFLFHMEPAAAESCLRNVVRLVKPGGYLFVSGVDLDVRTRVALDLGWTPVQDSLEEMHNGDSQVKRDWPWKYWGLEPLNKNRPDWNIRYASVFQVP